MADARRAGGDPSPSALGRRRRRRRRRRSRCSTSPACGRAAACSTRSPRSRCWGLVARHRGGAARSRRPRRAGDRRRGLRVGGIALAMVFVLLTFGGWSEAAYISAELRDRRRGAVHTFAWGLGIITVLYLLANAAYLRGLGLGGVAGSSAVAADLMRRARRRVGRGGGELRRHDRGALVRQRHHDHRREEQLRARPGRPAVRAFSAAGTRASTRRAPRSCCRAASRSCWWPSAPSAGAGSRRWWPTPRRCSG